MKNTLLFLSLALIITSFLTCDEEIDGPRSDWGYEYFPMEIGMQWNYEMDSITLRPQVGGVLFDSVHLFVKEILADTLRDLEDQLWYRGERYDRQADSLPWRFRQTFLLRRDGQRAYRQEDNLEFVKMTFPVVKHKNWDGHYAFDQYREIEVGGQPIAIYKDWDYHYVSIDETDIIHGRMFDSIAFIEGVDTGINDEPDEIKNQATEVLERRFSIEKYAAGIGLVYREMEVFDNSNGQCDDWYMTPGSTSGGWCITPWKEKAESGFIIRQWLVD